MIGNSWDTILKDEYEKEYFKKIMTFINQEYKTKHIYPAYENIFNALKYTDYKDVKVVIIGQDPYHNPGQAHGLSFSVQPGVPFPPSLQNIFLELKNDLGYEPPKSGCLEKWAKNGVLMLNSILTVEENKPASHKDIGWQIFTDKIIEKLNESKEPIVFILWGSFARSKKEMITNPLHYIVESNHPSPLSAFRGFFGSKPFSKANLYLGHFKKEVDWQL